MIYAKMKLTFQIYFGGACSLVLLDCVTLHSPDGWKYKEQRVQGQERDNVGHTNIFRSLALTHFT